MSGRRFSSGLAAWVVTELLPWMALLLGGISSVNVLPSLARSNARSPHHRHLSQITRSICGLRKRM